MAAIEFSQKFIESEFFPNFAVKSKSAASGRAFRHLDNTFPVFRFDRSDRQAISPS